MSDPIGAIALRALQQSPGGDGRRAITLDVGASDGPSFGDQLKNALNEASATQDKATDYIQRFVRGDPVELHDVMAATEEAGITIDMLVQLRNKLTDAYRAIVNMQS
ncbi:MAG TPA: flagellar hook-basal body complex protein FliE [Gemmatimonadaceae bacterium]|nr:flagellar hook-basal body complex protein FliE [Gemmatimonadaceae bacterium]